MQHMLTFNIQISEGILCMRYVGEGKKIIAIFFPVNSYPLRICNENS